MSETPGAPEPAATPQSTPSTVLVTGGAGFIGCSLARRLLARGCRVVAVDALHPQVHTGEGRPADLPAEVQLLPVDVRQEAEWSAVLRLVRPDAVVHLAAETGTGQSLTEATRHATVNVVGTTAMLDALYRAQERPGHIVLTSSRAVYGDGLWETVDGTLVQPPPRRHEDLVAGRWDPVAPDGGPLRPRPSVAGSTPPQPTNVYAATKLAQEHILSAWTAATGVALSVLRLQNVYGPGQSLTNSYTGVIAYFAQQAMRQEVIDVYEDGEIVRDFVFIEDVTAALDAALRRPPREPRCLDVGSGSPTTIRAAAARLAALCGAPEPHVSGRFRDGDVRAASTAIDATRAVLEWEPRTTLDAGFRELLAWIGTGGGSR